MKSISEIIKGLDCCSSEKRLCGECPYNEETSEYENVTCDERLMKHAAVALVGAQVEATEVDGTLSGTDGATAPERGEYIDAWSDETEVNYGGGQSWTPVPTESTVDDQEPDGGQSGTPVPTDRADEECTGGQNADEDCTCEEEFPEPPKACVDCVHLPICEWCAANTKELNWDKDGDTSNCAMRMPYSMFKEHSLDETVDGMLSPDYKERFKAEYQQTKIRYERLKSFNTKIKAAMMTRYSDGIKVEMPKHDCPDDILREQQAIMGQYLHILEVRAQIEGIEL